MTESEQTSQGIVLFPCYDSINIENLSDELSTLVEQLPPQLSTEPNTASPTEEEKANLQRISLLHRQLEFTDTLIKLLIPFYCHQITNEEVKPNIADEVRKKLEDMLKNKCINENEIESFLKNPNQD